MLRRAVSVGLLFLERLVSGFSGLFVFSLIARHYGPSVSGDYAYAVSILMMASGLSLALSALAVTPPLARRPHRLIQSSLTILWARLGWALILVAIGLPLLAMRLDGLRWHATWIVASTILILEPFSIGNVVNQVQERFGAVVAIRIASVTARVAVVAGVVALDGPPEAIAFAWVLEQCVMAICQSAFAGWFSVDRATLRASFRWRRLRAWFLHAVRYLPALAIGTVFVRLDRFVLADHLDPASFGVYANTMQVLESWLIVSLIVGYVMGPRWIFTARSRAQLHSGVLRLMAVLGALALAGCIGAYVLGPTVLELVYGPAYRSAGSLLDAAMLVGALYFLDQGVQLWLTALNRPRWILWKWSAAALIALVLLFLTPASLDAFAGPAALGAGLLGGWIVLAAVAWRSGRDFGIASEPARP